MDGSFWRFEARMVTVIVPLLCPRLLRLAQRFAQFLPVIVASLMFFVVRRECNCRHARLWRRRLEPMDIRRSSRNPLSP
jgi:hypothetical protein